MRAWILGCSFVWLGAGLVACGEPEQADEASATEALARPPSGKIRTPSGDFDAACVHEIPAGAVVGLDGAVSVNGAVVARHAPCAVNPAMRAPRVVGQGLQPPTTNGWVEASWANAATIGGLTYFNQLDANFSVPNAPAANVGQLIYLFPSVEANGAAILQPVLQYGSNGAFGGNYWTLASWYVNATNGYWSTPVTVNAGDSITSYIKLLDGSNSGFDFWVVSGTDTTLSRTSGTAFYTPKTPFNSAQQGVLEVYNVSGCNAYPSTGYMIFTNVTATQAGPHWNNYNPVTPAYWAASPSCGFQVTNFGSGGSEGTTLAF
jgi:hypothetical protein